MDFKRSDARELAAKTLPQESKETELGRLLARQRAELWVGLNPLRETGGSGTATATASATGATGTGTATGAGGSGTRPVRRWISIDDGDADGGAGLSCGGGLTMGDAMTKRF